MTAASTPTTRAAGAVSGRELPEVVLAVCDAHVAALEAALPGFLDGLYLHGSIGFGGEFHPTSDVDFVATCTRRATDDDVEVLRQVHSELARRWPSPAYDGFYLLETDLASRPEDVPEGPGILHEWFDVGHHADVQHVTWHELRHHGVTLHGKDLREIDIHTDGAALRAATREHLETFWRSQLEAMEHHPREASLPQAAEWGGLGPPRLHHLLSTGRLTSKSGAGRWALEAFPQHQEIVLEALRVRERPDDPSRYDDPARRREDLVAFMSEVIDDALRR
jgi:hypothetical protein